MSYNINYNDLRTFISDISKKCDSWVSRLEAINAVMTEMIQGDDFTGKGAESIKAYLSDVHIYLIGMIAMINLELKSRLILYVDGFYNYDDSFMANLNEDSMNDLRDRLNSVNTDIVDAHSSYSEILQSISDLFSESLPSSDTYSFTLSVRKTELVDYRDSIGEYDFSHIADTADLYEFMTTVESVIDSLRQIRYVDVTSYKSGDLLTLENIEILDECFIKSFCFYNNNIDNLNDAYAHQQKLYEEACVEARKEVGTFTFLVGALGFIITKNMKVSTTIGKILNATMGAIGINTAIEGLSDIYYGRHGDIESESLNILQMLCLGNEEFYDGGVKTISTLYAIVIPMESFIAGAELSLAGIIASIKDTGFSTLIKETAIDVSIQGSTAIVCEILGVGEAESIYIGSVLGTYVGFGGSVADDVVEAIDFDGTKNILTELEIEQYAYKAIKGSKKAKSIVLGKYESLKDKYGNNIYDDKGHSISTDNSYDSVAKAMNAQYFSLDNWEELRSLYSKDEIWKINEKFLDIQMNFGREIYLSHNPYMYIGDGSYYSKEIQYLIDNGYEFVKEGDVWHAIKK